MSPTTVPFDVAIVGAGPAGTSAAAVLARRGLRTVVLEKCAIPRYKTCGGGVTGRALSLLAPEVRARVASVVERRCASVTINVADAGLALSVARATPVISMTMRDRLDAVLAEAAETAGAELRPRSEVRNVVQTAAHVALDTAQGEVRARFVIAADGALSPLARRAGWRETRRLVPALEWEVWVDDRTFARLGEVARFDLRWAPGSYAWVFPKAAHLSIGIGTLTRRRRGGVSLPHALPAYLDDLGVARIEKLERHGFVIPIGPRRDGFARGRILLAGDAAGVAEPVTGEGISFAIESGQLAAQAIADGELDDTRVAPLYEHLARATILPELAWGRRLAAVTYRYPALHRALLRRHGRTLAEAMASVFLGERTYRELLTAPRNYARLVGLA